MGGGRRVVVVLVLTSLITFVTAPLFTTGHHNAWILCLIADCFFLHWMPFLEAALTGISVSCWSPTMSLLHVN